MKKALFILALICPAITWSQVLPNLGGQRAGSATLSFLKTDISPRSAAMGGASVAMPGFAQSVFTNPAGISQVTHLSFGSTQNWLGAGTSQSALYGIVPLKNKVSSIGVFVNSLNSGAIEVRTEFQPQGTGEQVFANNTAFGVAYGLQLTEYFSLGGTMRMVYEQLAEYKNTSATVDVGFNYQTDWNDLAFAVMIQNFGGNTSLSGDYTAENFNRSNVELEKYLSPRVFKLGLSMLAMDKGNQKIRVAFELNHPDDNAENFRLGAEYDFNSLLFVRAGYKINVKGQPYPVGGLGIKSRIGVHPFKIDYAVLPTDFLGLHHSISLNFQLNNDSRE